MIPYGKQNIVDEDINAVIDVLKSDYLTQGPKVPEFEQKVCTLVDSQFAVAVNSATSALHIACLALDVDSSSIVWTSPITFVASANCARLCGATIDFVDVEPTTGNMCPNALATKLEAAEAVGKLPKAIIVVHLAGHSSDMQAISKLANDYGIAVIEDASHAIGGSHDGNKVGSCQYSDMCIFSFHPVKIVTSAEGGMVTTQNPALAKRIELYRSHGITKDNSQLTRPNEGDWYYEQHELGLNYRMTDIHAALGISQLTRLDSFVDKRNQLAALYRELLVGFPLDIVEPLKQSYSARHLQIVRLKDPAKRRAVFDAMRKLGIQVHVHYFPVHLQPYYMKLGFKLGDFPNAESFYQQILTLPLFPDLESSEIQHICFTLREQFS
ncbi:UDP-4-amino-4,6-dideoxy-N-acetyl-beta-L-altrosamine transaminase [Alginatibacterium sediminis]|uniref:UDP-4-amino-4, 6-dideoxy-N-acetyl-beta-L-altrosamine transaminase n=1 Tax=Alginatibacterium sediminis TaxID=2164068 RepID=A0A420EG59_9ALTE|nr:UDP-4-amino-4,6-dideoxy-N-acetyl-beta-L-altrosamine transaminase [Alginatibacterium sediminis]RKF19650.1 UDP-4-amino-4,6-dideoxy-N-acetyl-beta-L-altrosamine transaminase [Alginatibacterium sediminis]